MVKTHVLVAIFFNANNEWKIWNNIFALFSPQLSWCKEVLFIAPNMASSRRLLYHSSSIINAHFQRTIPDVINLLSLLKNFIFRCVLFQMYYSYSNLKFRKKYLSSDLSPLFVYLFEYQQSNFFIGTAIGIWTCDSPLVVQHVKVWHLFYGWQKIIYA